MRQRRLKKIACFTAAAVISCVLPAESLLQVSGRTVQVVKADGLQSKVSGVLEADQGTDTSSGMQIAAGTDQSGDVTRTDTKNPTEPESESGTGTSADTKNPSDQGTESGTDASGNTKNPTEPGTESGTDVSSDTKNPTEPGTESGTDASSDTKNPTEPGTESGTDASSDTENPSDSMQPGNGSETDHTDNTDGSENPSDSSQPEDGTGTDPSEDPDHPSDPDSTDQKDDQKEPEAPKLSKPVLKAASKPDGTIKLSWKKVKGAEEYVLLCSTKKDSGFHRIYATKKDKRVYKHQGRVPGKVYYYQLAVFSKGRAGRADSKIVAGRSLEQVKLTEISNVSGSRNLVLHWSPVAGADGYEILRKNKVTGSYEPAGTVNGSKTSFTDRKRTGGTIETYKVYAKDANGGRSGYSQSMSQMAIDKDKKMIALTYDDGPSAYTPIVLDALAKYDGHATFFVVGTSVNSYAGSLRRAASMGCEIGNHTYNHSNLKNLSSGQVQSVVSRTSQAVKDLTGVTIRLLRPPYGSYNNTTFAAAGMPVIMWSVDTLDWKTRSTSATIQSVQKHAYDGAIVLMHDLHHPTALAADAIMKYLKSAGYQLVTVSEMAAYRGGLNNHKAYSQFRK